MIICTSVLGKIKDTCHSWTFPERMFDAKYKTTLLQAHQVHSFAVSDIEPEERHLGLRGIPLCHCDATRAWRLHDCLFWTASGTWCARVAFPNTYLLPELNRFASYADFVEMNGEGSAANAFQAFAGGGGQCQGGGSIGV